MNINGGTIERGNEFKGSYKRKGGKGRKEEGRGKLTSICHLKGRRERREMKEMKMKDWDATRPWN